MNTGFLSNPAPDSGYNAIMAALQPHAAPAEGTLGGTNPSVHNRVKQTFVNPVATYPFIARKWSGGYEQTFHEGDLMFIFTGTSKAVLSSRSCSLANLSSLNTIMQSKEIVLQPFQNPDNWTFIGVMRNSSAASNQNTKRHGEQGGNRFSTDQIINIDVRGATKMFNYWPDLKCGNELWLVWKKDPLTNKFKLVPLQKNEPLPNHSFNVAVDGQFAPIRAGWIFQSIGAGERSYDDIVQRCLEGNANHRFTLPMVNAFVRI